MDDDFRLSALCSQLLCYLGRLVELALIGTDIQQVSRLEKVMARAPRFAQKVFTPAERDYCEAQGRPAQHYCARFCAKEAFAKALGVPLSWQEVEVVKNGSGLPAIRALGRAHELLAGRSVRISVSHSGDYAVAMVLIENS